MKQWILLTSAALSLFAAACDTPAPEPEPAPSPADSLAVDFATTRRLTPDDLLSPELKAAVQTASDGTYFVECEGEEIACPLSALSSYDGKRSFRKYCNYEITYDFTLGNPPAVPAGAAGDIDLSALMPASVNLGSRAKGTTIYASSLPEGLKSIESITLTENSRIKVSLSIPNAFFTDGSVVPSFEVDMTHFFESPDAEDGILRFDAPMNKGNGWSVTRNFRLSGAVFDPAGYDAEALSLEIAARIGLAGKVEYSNLKTTASRLRAATSPILLHVSVVLYDVECATIRGAFDFKTRETNTTVDFRDFASLVAGMDISASELVFKSRSDLTLPSFVNLSLNAKANRRVYAKVENLSLPIPAASADGPADGVAVLRAASAPGLADLFSRIPEDLVVAASISTDPETVGTLEIGRSYSTVLTPAFRVPLVCGPDYRAVSCDTVAVPAALREALKGGEARIVGEISNSLPLNGRVSVKLIADNGEALTDEVSQTVGPGATQAVSMTLRKNYGADSERATRAVVSLQAEGAGGSKALGKDGSLQASLKLRYLPASE